METKLHTVVELHLTLLKSKMAKMFDKMWIFSNPGDAGSALGCILAKSKKD